MTYRHLWCGALLAALLPAQAQTPPTPVLSDAAWSPIVLPASHQLDVRSKATGHAYRIFMSVPASPPPPSGHPVLYVLDANAAFPVAAFMARSAQSRREVTGHVPPLVVGIGYPGDADFHVEARRRDYTGGTGKPEATAPDGGAELFLDFIEQELKPLVARHHAIDPQRQALFGHSFGGLFVLHTLFTRPGSFSSYLASSPSIWWQDKRVLGALPGLMKNKQMPRLQLSVGALEDDPPKGHYPPEVRAMMAKRPMVSEARQLFSRLRQVPAWEDKVVYHELAGEQHGPAWLPAMTRGMQFFLEQP